MSQENIERVHRLYEAFNRRDLDAFLGFIDPEVDFTSHVVQVAGAPEAGRFLVLDHEQRAPVGVVDGRERVGLKA